MVSAIGVVLLGVACIALGVRAYIGEQDIAILKGENLILVKAVKVHAERLGKLEESMKQNVLDSRKELTSDPAKPKIVPKPQRTSWKQFRSAAEKASDPEREEA